MTKEFYYQTSPEFETGLPNSYVELLEDIASLENEQNAFYNYVGSRRPELFRMICSSFATWCFHETQNKLKEFNRRYGGK